MPRPSKMAVQNNRELLSAALEGLEIQRQRIEEQIRQVRAMLGARGPGRPRATEKAGGSEPIAPAPAAGRRKRVLSPAARKRIAAAQKKRWAEFRKREGQAEND